MKMYDVIPRSNGGYKVKSGARYDFFSYGTFERTMGNGNSKESYKTFTVGDVTYRYNVYDSEVETAKKDQDMEDLKNLLIRMKENKHA